jgi:hypothetical protein
VAFGGHTLHPKPNNLCGWEWSGANVQKLVDGGDLEVRNTTKIREILPKYMCAKLVASYPRRLDAVIPAKGASTKY